MKPELKNIVLIYQKNRNEKRPTKIIFDELGYYHQIFESSDITVKKFINLPRKNQIRHIRALKKSKS